MLFEEEEKPVNVHVERTRRGEGSYRDWETILLKVLIFE